MSEEVNPGPKVEGIMRAAAFADTGHRYDVTADAQVTEAMVEAGEQALREHTDEEIDVSEIYIAMRKAAPVDDGLVERVARAICLSGCRQNESPDDRMGTLFTANGTEPTPPYRWQMHSAAARAALAVLATGDASKDDAR